MQDATLIKQYNHDDFNCPFCSNAYLNFMFKSEYHGFHITAVDYFLECPTCFTYPVYSGKGRHYDRLKHEEVCEKADKLFEQLTKRFKILTDKCQWFMTPCDDEKWEQEIKESNESQKRLNKILTV